MPISLASLMPWIRASYSATLFDAAKWIGSTYLSLSPLGEVRTIPAPSPDNILEPSKCICQNWESGHGGSYWVSAQSTRKSARAWDLTAVRGSYWMPWVAISMAHFATLPDASRLPMISASGAELMNVIG